MFCGSIGTLNWFLIVILRILYENFFLWVHGDYSLAMYIVWLLISLLKISLVLQQGQIEFKNPNFQINDINEQFHTQYKFYAWENAYSQIWTKEFQSILLIHKGTCLFTKHNEFSRMKKSKKKLFVYSRKRIIWYLMS